MNQIKRLVTIFFPVISALPAAAQTEIGPEGDKLIWFLVGIAAVGILVFFGSRFLGKGSSSGGGSSRGKSPGGFNPFQKPLFGKRRVRVELEKDRLYYPDFLKLTITNTGTRDVDIDTPLLIFSSIWLSRKFKLKGTNNSFSYPIYLMKGQNHTLTIDLERFYRFDKTLKRLPRVRVVVPEVNGKSLGSCKVLLRKTLFNI